MRQYWDILRPLNCAMAGAAGALAYWFSAPLGMNALLIFVSFFAICGAGNSVNDFFDRDIDAKTKKHRPIPSGKISPADALLYSSILFFIGIVISYQLGLQPLLLAVLTSILLIAYPMALKKVKWFGNIVVSALVAAPFVYGGLSTGVISNEIIILSLSAFLANLSREIIKDIEDIKANEKNTIPKLIGKDKAATVAAIILAIAVCIAIFGVDYANWLLLTIGIGFALCAISRMISREKGYEVSSSKCIKASMIFILLSFIAARFF